MNIKTIEDHHNPPSAKKWENEKIAESNFGLIKENN